jgi:hypothetical protein
LVKEEMVAPEQQGHHFLAEVVVVVDLVEAMV